eukprot:4309526-Pleurochrysis_carterae.AAC.1
MTIHAHAQVHKYTRLRPQNGINDLPSGLQIRTRARALVQTLKAERAKPTLTPPKDATPHLQAPRSAFPVRIAVTKRRRETVAGITAAGEALSQRPRF